MGLELAHVLYAIVAIVVVWVISGSKAAEEPKKEAATGPAKKEAAQKPAKKEAAVSKPSTAAAPVVAKPPAPVAKKVAKLTEEEAEAELLASVDREDKKKAKKAKKAKKVVKVVAPVVEAAPAPEPEESDSDDDDDKPKVAKAAVNEHRVKSNDAESAFGMSSSEDAAAGVFDDGLWNVVEKLPKTKKAHAKKAASAAAPAAAAAAAAPALVTKAMQHHNDHAVTEQKAHKEEVEAAPAGPEPVIKMIKIESKRVGAVVGKAGVTLKAIQEATECEIRILKDKDAEEQAELVDVSVTGTESANVALAAKSVTEMATKGYCLLLKGENFSEGSIAVHPSSLGEIVGKGGTNLRAIQDAFDVKLSTPPGNVDRSSDVPVKVGVVGDRNQVKKAKECIKQLAQWHHTDATHPGFTHAEMDLDAATHKYIIGPKGSEIHHIQKNFHVSVHIPNANSAHTGVLVVGEADNVTKAGAYINKVVEKALAPREEKEKPTQFELKEQAKAAEEEAEIEPWMRTYIKEPKSHVLDLNDNAFPAMG